MRKNYTSKYHIGTSAVKGDFDGVDQLSPEFINPSGLFHGSYIPEWLELIPTISAGAKLCYARLCRYAGKNGVAWPHEDTLAAKLGGVTDRTVRNYLDQLKRAGLIDIR